MVFEGNRTRDTRGYAFQFSDAPGAQPATEAWVLSHRGLASVEMDSTRIGHSGGELCKWHNCRSLASLPGHLRLDRGVAPECFSRRCERGGFTRAPEHRKRRAVVRLPACSRAHSPIGASGSSGMQRITVGLPYAPEPLPLHHGLDRDKAATQIAAAL